MRETTERLLVVFSIVVLAAFVGKLDERFIGQQDAQYVSMRNAWNEWRASH